MNFGWVAEKDMASHFFKWKNEWKDKLRPSHFKNSITTQITELFCIRLIWNYFSNFSYENNSKSSAISVIHVQRTAKNNVAGFWIFKIIVHLLYLLNKNTVYVWCKYLRSRPTLYLKFEVHSINHDSFSFFDDLTLNIFTCRYFYQLSY